MHKNSESYVNACASLHFYFSCMQSAHAQIYRYSKFIILTVLLASRAISLKTRGVAAAARGGGASQRRRGIMKALALLSACLAAAMTLARADRVVINFDFNVRPVVFAARYASATSCSLPFAETPSC